MTGRRVRTYVVQSGQGPGNVHDQNDGTRRMSLPPTKEGRVGSVKESAVEEAFTVENDGISRKIKE